MEQVQYILNANSKVTGVIVPIDLWREIESERETARLLQSENMKRRLLEAKNRKEGIPLDDVCTQLGI
ncbi:MAG: hypothetical protein QTN59_06670 [Candidatus Electrothrix communis]|nr:MAG: hypothetical protein QTN59_06670 [Candidatus Electrothrix communis]